MEHPSFYITLRLRVKRFLAIVAWILILRNVPVWKRPISEKSAVLLRSCYERNFTCFPSKRVAFANASRADRKPKIPKTFFDNTIERVPAETSLYGRKSRVRGGGAESGTGVKGLYEYKAYAVGVCVSRYLSDSPEFSPQLWPRHNESLSRRRSRVVN